MITTTKTLRKTQRELKAERAREQRERMERTRRAGAYHARLWRDHAIATGYYMGIAVPPDVLLAMRAARSTHLRGDLSPFDRSGPLGPPVAIFPYRSEPHDRDEDGDPGEDEGETLGDPGEDEAAGDPDEEEDETIGDPGEDEDETIGDPGEDEDRLAWFVHACGSVTIDDPNPNPDF